MPRSTPTPHYRLSPRAVLFAALAVVAPAQAADDAALARCREIADPTARLACYDALPKSGVEARPGTTAPAPAAAPAPSSAPGTQAKPPAEQFGLENRTSPPKTMAELFGLESRTPPPKTLDQIDVRVLGTFEGWWPDAFIKLVNGQVWQVTDGTSRFYQIENATVTITRGIGGAFYLNLVGDNRTVRVKRVQ